MAKPKKRAGPEQTETPCRRWAEHRHTYGFMIRVVCMLNKGHRGPHEARNPNGPRDSRVIWMSVER
jgi:hypothetical protein